MMKSYFIESLFCLVLVQVILTNPVKENEVNPMENPNLFGGDMVGIDFETDRKAIPNNSNRWPEGIIYYTIDKSLIKQREVIRKAMEHISQKTCIKFIPRTNQRDYVHFYSGNGCFSNVGRTGGKQLISLGNGCHYLSTVVHEITHSLGFFHEQNRSDRDKYIVIHFENINPTKLSNFRLLHPNQNRLFTNFDFKSVMLYGPTAFSKNKKITMESKVKGNEIVNHPHNEGYSALDIEKVQKLYNC